MRKECRCTAEGTKELRCTCIEVCERNAGAWQAEQRNCVAPALKCEEGMQVHSGGNKGIELHLHFGNSGGFRTKLAGAM